MMINTPTRQIMIRAHLGFSMIDVLIAILVLATGLLALGVLQGALARNGADARARTQVAAYSETLIDKTRASGYDAFGSVISVTPSSSACSASPQSFTQSLQCEAYNTQTYAGVSNLATTIISTEYYGSTGGTWVTAKPSGYTDKTPHYKQVNVTSTWTDSVGQSRTQTYDTTISPVTVNPGDNSLASTSFVLTVSTTPQVREANPANTLGVIPIAISNTSDAAATNPKPVVTNTGTTFSQYTYNSTASQYGGNLITQRVDTKVVQCKCKYGGAATNDPNLGTILAQPYRPTYWDGYHYTTPVATSSSTSSTGLESNVTQDTGCDVCCRDRNDTASDKVKFDSFSSDYNHYKFAQVNGVYTLVASTDSYQQACRLIRVDGSYATATDAHNYFFGLLSTDTCANQSSSAAPTGCTSSLDFSDTIPSSTTENNYASFVKDYLKTNFSSLSSTGKSGEAVASPLTSSSAAGGKWNGGTFANATSALNINPLTNSTNTTITLPNSVSRWLYARGLYVDFLESPARTALSLAISGCTDSDVNNCALPVLPFTTINMSELGDTSSSDPSVIVVSNTAVIGGDETSPKRGNVTVPSTQMGSGTPSPTANGVYTVYVTNSSLTAVEPTATTSQANSPYDTQNTLLDQRKFTVVGAGGGGGSGGSVYFDVNLSGLPYLANAQSVSKYNSNFAVNWSGTAAQLGTAASGSTTGYLTTGTYPVLFAGGKSTTPVAVATTLTPPVGLTINVQGFNTNSTLSGIYGTETVACTGGNGSNSYTATNQAMQCYSYAVDTGNVKVGGVSAGLTSANVSYSGTSGGMNRLAAITLPASSGISGTTNTIAGATNVIIPFTLTGTTIAQGTCTCTGQCNKPKYTAGTCSN